ncbi:MAG TPA: hypothetical protein VKT71_01030 [Candidatus Acidoferrales bacterium]|nr:hypothetical protein [Candidatus Acidoferrales bacterium]
MRRLHPKLVLLAAALAAFSFAGVAFSKDKPVPWRTIDDALFRVNDAPVKSWAVYETGKKRDPLLVQMDSRYLVIKIHERQVFEVDPAKIQRKSAELLWDPSDHPAEPLAVTDWDASDTEAVFRILAKLTAEDRLLDIELPHPLDLSGMSPHAKMRRD